MFARILYRTYFAGVGASGLGGIYLSDKDHQNEKTNKKELDRTIDEFIGYSARCGVGFIYGLICGVVWPMSLLGKTFSLMNQSSIITKNN